MGNDDKAPKEEPVVQPIESEVEVTGDSSPTDEPNLEASIDAVEATEVSEDGDSSADQPNPVKKKPAIVDWYLSHKKMSIPLTLLLLVIILLAIPFTRYAVLGTFMKKNVTVTVLDSTRNKAVTQATVSVGSEKAETDKEGKAQLSVPVGFHELEVTKKYYKTVSKSVEVGVFNDLSSSVSFQATGRVTTVKVLNKISGQPAANVTVAAASDNEALTDSSGVANLVLPANSETVELTLSGNSFVTAKATLTVDEPETLTVVPEGTVYFLSKQTGKIDVVSTNLDGSNRKTLLKGSGFEEDSNTSLLASRDWRYLALKSKRTSDKPASLWLIDTKSGDVKEVDTGDIEVQLIGWAGHNFWYSIGRNNLEYWQSKSSALKVYKADTGSLSIVDETSATGNGNDETAATLDFQDVYILNDRIAYVKEWSVQDFAPSANRDHAIVTVGTDGNGKKTVRAIKASSVNFISSQLYEPQEIYYALYGKNGDITQFLELEDGVVKEAETTESKFNQGYPTFIVSPSSKKTFWRESRDGKNALFVGDINAQNEAQVVLASDFTPYGWLSDDYILLQKNNSELYASTINQLKNGAEPVKISNYHRPDYSYGGYGYGYGGQ